jgi:putative oligomerization/nucleic acid binding protein
MFGKQRRKRKHLERNGKRAPATVVEIAALGWETEGGEIGDIVGDIEDMGVGPGSGTPEREIIRKTKLRVRPADEPEFELEQRIRYGAYGREVPKAGDEIEVLYDPEDHEKVMVAPPTAEEEALRTAEALSKAKIGFTVGGHGGRPRPASAEDLDQATERNEQAMDQAQAMLQQYNAMAAASSGTPAGSDDNFAQLERLQALREKGELSEAEFEAAKAKLLGGG